MRAILHLGTEKTGTSTIQRFLKKNRKALIEQGFYFMKSTGEADDRKLSVYCLLEEQFDDFHRNNLIDTKEKKQEFEKKLEIDVEREIRALPSNVHTIIFSSEHFHSRVRNEQQRDKLKNFLFRHFDDVGLLSYVRPQIDVAISHYSTYLKTQGYGSLTEYLVQCKPDNYYYDYWNYLSGWEESFPSSNFSVRVFDKKELVDGDVVADFCQAVGLDYSDLEDIDPVNESVTPTGQELLKVINKNYDAFIKGVGKNPARIAMVQVISRLFAGSGQRPSANQARVIQSQFDDINEKVCQRWFPNRDSLFKINYAKFDQQEAIDRYVVNFFDHFISKYVKVNKAKLVGIPSAAIDKLRDTAVSLENRNIEASLSLMKTASFLRPEGDFIRKKIREYNLQVNSVEKNYYLKNFFRAEKYFGGGYSCNRLEFKKKMESLSYSGYKPNEIIPYAYACYADIKIGNTYREDMDNFIKINECKDEEFLVVFGDGVSSSRFPVFLKNRKISDNRAIILNFNSGRHWRFYHEGLLNEDLKWCDKINDIVWRGINTGESHGLRYNLVSGYNKKYDIGFSSVLNSGKDFDKCKGFVKGRMEIKEQLKYKYIVSIEGNDVATSLKWILSSGSVPMMPKPTRESWLLESQLIPYVHYVPLNDNLDNLDEVYNWCLDNDAHCQQIAENGKRYMEMFFDEENEKDICRMIYKKYIEIFDLP